MSSVFYLILRRIRWPLILIVVVYTVATIGLALVPGVDADGNTTPGMGIFTAFYVISYTGTTIGFGEIPSPYSPPQRLWMIFSIYATVIGWSWAFVTLISLLGERGMRDALADARFARRMKAMREPFYIVCGFGETGRMVCHGLDRLNLRFVLIESDPDRLDEAVLDEFASIPPKSRKDAAQPTMLTDAGLQSKHCRGVIALTASDETNQAIGVTCRLLRPDVPVLARISDPEFDTHLGVLGGDIVINPFERFAEALAAAVVAPEHYRLREVLTSLPGDPLPPLRVPPVGHWVVAGYGRFGHAITEGLRAVGQTVSVVDYAHFGEGGVDVKGRGTETGTLQAAGIDHAVGIVIGNHSDPRNLAIAVHARDLNPKVYVVIRQNQLQSEPLFDAFDEDLVVQPSRIVAEEFLAVITTPLLGPFLAQLPGRDEQECSTLSRRIEKLTPRRVPENWSFRIDEADAPAIARALGHGMQVPLGVLGLDPRDLTRRLRVVPLAYRRDGVLVSEPPTDEPLRLGDELLFVGASRARRDQELTRFNENSLDFVLTGKDHGTGWVWQKLFDRRPDNQRAN